MEEQTKYRDNIEQLTEQLQPDSDTLKAMIQTLLEYGRLVIRLHPDSQDNLEELGIDIDAPVDVGMDLQDLLSGKFDRS